MKLRASNRFSTALIATFAASICLTMVSQAIDITKLDNTDNLNLGSSWSGGNAPTATDVAVWDSTVTFSNSVLLGADASWQGVRIANPGGAVTINAGNALTLGTAGIDVSAATQNLTLANSVVLGGPQVWNVGTSRTLTASGVVSGSGTVNKTGVGQLTLSNANTFNNGMTVSAGTVVAGNNAACGTGTLTLGGGAFTTSGVRTFTNAINVAASTTTNVFGYSGGGNYPVLNGVITGSGTISNYNDGSRGGLGNVLINGDISGFTGTFSYNNTGSGNNFQFNSGTAASTDGSQANFVASGNASNSPGQWLFNNIGTGAFKMGSLSGTGGNVTGNSTNVTFEVGALNTDTSFAGVIRQISGTANLSKVGTGRLVLTGTNTYNGATTINNGTLGLTKDAALPGSVSFGASNTTTLQLTAPLAADSWTFTKPINGGSANAKVEKTGLGRVILTPAASSAFVGNSVGSLTVTQGRLDLNSAGFTTTPSVSVAGGATFGGTSTAGAVTVGNGGIVEGGSSGSGTLTAASLTFNNTGTLNGMLSAGVTPIIVTGAVTTTGGSNSVSVSPLNVPVSGTYHLVGFGSLSGSLGDFKFTQPTRGLSLALNGNFLDVVVASGVSFPVWTGGATGEWSYAASLGNWKLASDSSPTDFFALDNVLFDDSATGTTDVVVGVDNLNVGSITFNNSSKNYTLTQANGKDIASGILTKTGTGKVTIAGSFSFSGGSTLSGGIVSIDNEASLGFGTRILNGGTLEYIGASTTWIRGIALNTGGTVSVTDSGAVVTQSGAITGTGTLAKSGAGSLSLSLAGGTYSNALTINNGTLDLNYGANAVTLSGAISGSSGVLSLTGTGATATTGLTLTGTNTFTGETHIYGRRVFLDNPVGNAIGGDIVIKQSNWPVHGLTILRDEQIANTAVLRFDGVADAYDFRLNGKTETLAGISCTDTHGIIENAGYDGGNDSGITNNGTLISAGSGTYSYNAGLRDRNNGSSGVLNFTKSGSGTQVLSGAGITYTGATTVNGGTLTLSDTTGFASSGVTMNGGTLELNRASGNWSFGQVIAAGSGAGNVTISGFGTVTLSAANTYTGITTIESGFLSVSGSIAGSPLIDVQYDGTLSAITVGSGQTVQGSGMLAGVTFGNGSTLTPGSAVGIDTILGSGTITFSSGSTCAMEVNRTGGVISNDQLSNMDAVTYGGTLTVTATGQAFANGDVVQLFPGAFSYGGAFDTVNLPSLTSGLSWDLSNLIVDGSIKVVNFTATPIFNPPAGGYVGAQSVSISSDTGSTIYYTMDGTPPTLGSPSGLSPVSGLTIPTNSSVTIRAFATKSGQADSPPVSATYNTITSPIWISDSYGNWQDTFNWQSDVVAQGVGVTADFSTLTTTGLNTVFLNGPRTVGSLIFGDLGDQNGWDIAPGTTGTLVLNNGANPPVVTVTNQTTTIDAPVSSSNGLLKNGAGTLNLNAANSITGTVNIAEGTLRLSNAGAIPNGSAITLGSNGATNPTLTLNFGAAKTFGALTVPSGVAGATFAMLQNTGTYNFTFPGATLSSPLTFAQSNAGFPNWNQFIWTSKITGIGGGSGNDTLVFNNTSGTQNYFSTASSAATHDFSGNIHLMAGLVAVQELANADGNIVVPDASMLWIETGEWRWNTGSTVETIDGLRGAGLMGNPGNVTLTINAANSSNDGNRNFTGTMGTMGGALTKNGAGTQKFSGTGITYTNASTINGGTLELSETTAFASSSVTVNAGTLLVNNTTGTGTGTTSTVTVKSGATVAGEGSLGGTTTIEAGGIVAPGNGGIGTLAANNVNFSGTCQIQVGDTTSDLVAILNTLTTIGTPTIAISTVGTPTAASYTIVNYGAVSGTLPTITGVPSGYSVNTATAGQIKLVKDGGYNTWADSWAGLTDKTPGGDPDHDGITNLMEYVIGGDPRVSSEQFLPKQTIVGSDLVISYKRSDESENDTTQTGQWSATLGSWTNIPPVLVNENGTNPDDMTVTIPMSNAVNGKLFGRIKVTQP